MSQHPITLAAALCLLISQSGLAESPDDIVKIEEFWELKVANPDPGYIAPQIASAFAPVKQGDVLYATLAMNHHLDANGEFVGGGMQLQLWHGEMLMATRTSEKKALLNSAGETITWKQEMSVDANGTVRLSICDGVSETWGSFGQNLSLAVATSLSSLNHYHPNDSIDHSGVVFAANRVEYLRLTKVRATFRSGATKTVTPIN